ncbi:MAG: CBS domain-containing protein [Rhodothalassiaceae bacterium]
MSQHPSSGSAARRAADIMRPPDGIVHVDHGLDEAMTRFKRNDSAFLIVMDGDEVVGHLRRDQLEPWGDNGGVPRNEMVGNLMVPQIRSCRQTDDLGTIRQIFEESGLDLLAVIDELNQLRGWIDRSDVGLDPNQAEPDALRRDANPTGGRTTPAPQEDQKVYSEQPSVKQTGSRRETPE